MIITIEEADLDADGELRVSGWAAGNEVIDTINIMIASTRIGEAERGLARKDIALQYPHWKESAYSGFVFRYTLEPNLQKATHVFVVVTVAGYPAQAATRAVRKIPKLIKKPEETLPFHCDNSALYDDGTIDIAGWATHVSGIERIAVQLDKTPLGFADYGKMRPDVGKSYPDIASALHSGFTFHTQLTPLDAGEHDIALTIHTLRGDRFVRQWKAPVQIAGTPSVTNSGTNDDPIRLFVDKPQIVDGAFVEPVQRLLALEGWAIARQGVAAVEVYLDDAPVGKASRGIRRSDIGKNFADWPEIPNQRLRMPPASQTLFPSPTYSQNCRPRSRRQQQISGHPGPRRAYQPGYLPPAQHYAPNRKRFLADIDQRSTQPAPLRHRHPGRG